MIKINKSGAVILGVIIFLAAAVAVLGAINYARLTERRELLQGCGTFLVTSGEYTRVVSPDDILEIGYMRVSAADRGERRNFTGVPLAGLFAHLDIDLSGADFSHIPS